MNAPNETTTMHATSTQTIAMQTINMQDTEMLVISEERQHAVYLGACVLGLLADMALAAKGSLTIKAEDLAGAMRMALQAVDTTKEAVTLAQFQSLRAVGGAA